VTGASGEGSSHPQALEILSQLVEELGKYPSFADLMASAKSKNWMPGFVSAGEKRSLYFSPNGEKIVRRLSTVLKANDPTVSRSHTDAEWHHMVRSSLGPAFASVEDNNIAEPLQPEAILGLVLKAIAWRPGLSEVSFGAQLPNAPNLDTLLLGPVRFERREQWLASRAMAGQVSSVTERRILRAWNDRPNGKRRPSVHSYSERDILDAVGGFHYVCTVTSAGLAADAARARSLTAARLGLTAISLAWESPSSCLRGIVLKPDQSGKSPALLRLKQDQPSFADRWRVDLPFGPRVEAAKWAELALDYRDVWQACGSIFEYYLSADTQPSKPTVTTALLHGLLWFFEGCRQELDHIAVVNFSACLDALANGKDKRGIERLITRRLGYSRDAPIFVGGPSMRSLIDDIYSDGRSKTIHGTGLNLRSDWTGTRDRSEKLARLALVACLSWAAQNRTDQSPETMQTS
jgi:hypothetical protein